MSTSVRKFCEAAIIFLLFVVLSLCFVCPDADRSQFSKPKCRFLRSRSVIPFPTGTALPPTCTPGAVFFKTDARAGANIYACSSQDVWTLQSSGSSSATWGNITGVLTNQTDLNTALSGKAGSVHQHSATDITSGVVPAARLGSGTADATTVLYGETYFARFRPERGGRVWHEYIRCPGRRACQRRSKRHLRDSMSGKRIFVRELRRPDFRHSGKYNIFRLRICRQWRRQVRFSEWDNSSIHMRFCYLCIGYQRYAGRSQYLSDRSSDAQ